MDTHIMTILLLLCFQRVYMVRGVSSEDLSVRMVLTTEEDTSSSGTTASPICAQSSNLNITSCATHKECSSGQSCCLQNETWICGQLQPNTTHTCLYNGTVYASGDSVFNNGSVQCKCTSSDHFLPGQITCSSTEGSCPEMWTLTHRSEDLPPHYQLPFVENCPTRGEYVLVRVQPDRNVGYLTHQFRFTDWQNRELEYKVKQFQYHICNCTTQPVYDNIAISEPDVYGNTARCCFKVIVDDIFHPIFYNCPQWIRVESGKPVIWQEPVALDNVGIKSLSVTSHSNGTAWAPGSYMVTYEATDWSNNVAKCSIFITVSGSTTSSRETHPTIAISASVISILSLVILVIGMLTVRNVRHRRYVRRNRNILTRIRNQQRSNERNEIGAHGNSVFTVFDSEPPPYDIAVSDKLPEYVPEDSPPQYRDVITPETIDNGSTETSNNVRPDNDIAIDDSARIYCSYDGTSRSASTDTTQIYV